MLEYLSCGLESFYQVMWIFLTYAFLGWCMEVSYAALDLGKFVNRGFLNGPVCPIYGVGMVIVTGILTPLKENLIVLFVGSILLTTILEFLVGFVLEKVFHNKWWDYSMYPFNICGYICLKFSLIWGFACVFVVDLLHPILMKVIHWIPTTAGIVMLSIFSVMIMVDGIITIANILNLNKRIRLLDEIGKELKKISNELGENIYENVIEAVEKKESIKETVEEKKVTMTKTAQEKRRELERLQNHYKEILSNHQSSNTRLLKAFPNMTSGKHSEGLENLKKELAEQVHKLKKK
ncbi:MAG: hypothetical protein RSD97_07555 [Lachnospiraceae bacterium]